MIKKKKFEKFPNRLLYFSIISAFLSFFLFLLGCQTSSSQDEPFNLDQGDQEISVTTSSELDIPIQDEDAIVTGPKEEIDEPEQIVEQLPENIPVDILEDISEPDEYVPSEDLFISTFSRVEEIIRELNGIIQARDFNRWVLYLTDEHRLQLSSPAYLQEVSRRPILANRSIVLKNLQDYFLQVVVPSRANLRLDDLVFINEQKVQAFMMFGDTKVSLYQLVFVDGDWKIGEF